MQQRDRKIIVLGGGADQIDLINELKSRGYYTILIDYNQNPPASQYADEHIQESTLDIDVVTRIAKDSAAENIITACTDQALLTMATVAERLSMPCMISVEQARNVTNKTYMKELMGSHGIPTAKFKTISEIDDTIEGLQFPLMVKPADCNSSKGVRKVENESQYQQYIGQALKISRSGMAIVEEFKDGTEVSIDAYATNSGVKVIMIGELKKKFVNESTQLIYQNLIPAQISEKAKRKIHDVALLISQVFSIKNSPLLLQAIVNGDDVDVIEFSARLGGGCKHHTIKAYTGIDIMKANVDSLLGVEVEVNDKDSKTNKIISRIHIYLKPGILGKIDGSEKLKAEGIIEEFIQNKPLGTDFTFPAASTDRLGSLLFKADSMDELSARISKALKEMSVLDVNGEDMMFKDIYNQYLN